MQRSLPRSCKRRLNHTPNIPHPVHPLSRHTGDVTYGRSPIKATAVSCVISPSGDTIAC